mmetsp:Transcript_67501/g.200682  ORF Transcript_67501/g.200682 Transcript_67501/m.200682 type:complete len:203 (+) Transcript_67501:661-1269(+)
MGTDATHAPPAYSSGGLDAHVPRAAGVGVWHLGDVDRGVLMPEAPAERAPGPAARCLWNVGRSGLHRHCWRARPAVVHFFPSVGARRHPGSRGPHAVDDIPGAFHGAVHRDGRLRTVLHSDDEPPEKRHVEFCRSERRTRGAGRSPGHHRPVRFRCLPNVYASVRKCAHSRDPLVYSGTIGSGRDSVWAAGVVPIDSWRSEA